MQGFVMQLKNSFTLFISLVIGCALYGCSSGGGGSSESPSQAAGTAVVNVSADDPLPPEVRNLISHPPVMPASAQLSGNASSDVLIGRWATACLPNKRDSTGGYVVYVADIQPLDVFLGQYVGKMSFYAFSDALCLQAQSQDQYTLRAVYQFVEFDASKAAGLAGVPYDPNTPFSGTAENWYVSLTDANQKNSPTFGFTVGLLPGGTAALVQAGGIVWPTADAVLAVKL